MFGIRRFSWQVGIFSYPLLFFLPLAFMTRFPIDPPSARAVITLQAADDSVGEAEMQTQCKYAREKCVRAKSDENPKRRHEHELHLCLSQLSYFFPQERARLNPPVKVRQAEFLVGAVRVVVVQTPAEQQSIDTQSLAKVRDDGDRTTFADKDWGLAETALDSFLSLTDNTLVKLTETGLVAALGMHMALGFRILAIEFLGFRERTISAISACAGVAFVLGLAFLLNAG